MQTTHDSEAHEAADSIGFVVDCVECHRERLAVSEVATLHYKAALKEIAECPNEGPFLRGLARTALERGE